MEMATNGAPSFSGAPGSTQPRSDGANDGADGVLSLDDVAFDSSLSFLEDVVGNGSSPFDHEAPLPASPVLPDVVDDDTTEELLSDLFNLIDQDGDAGSVQQSEDGPHNGSAPDGSPHTSDVAEKPQSKSKSTISRQREEIKYLREQVGHLEGELARLQQHPSPANENSGRTKMWEGIAKRQLSEKQRAEIENIKLREQLEYQLRVAKSLEKLLRKRSLAHTDSLFRERKRPRGASRIDLAASCNLIRSRIEKRFDDIDPVFAQIGLLTTLTEMDDARAASGPDNAIFMEMIMVKSFPFQLHDVANAVWQCLSRADIPLDNGFYGATEPSGSVCDFKLAVTMRLRRSEVTISAQGIAARRVEKSRSLIVFETVGATEGALFAGRNILMTECGYIVFEEGPPDEHSDASTVVKVCVRMWPEMEDADAEDGSEVQTGVFVDLVTGSYNENVKTMLQIVENTLLEQIQHASHA